MHEKALVLGRDERVDDVLRQVVPRDEDAAALADFRNQAAVAAENAQRNLQRDVADRLRLRQSGLHIVIGADDAGRKPDAAQGAAGDQDEQGAHQLMSPIVTWARFFFA